MFFLIYLLKNDRKKYSMNVGLKIIGILNIQAAKVEAFIFYFIQEPFWVFSTLIPHKIKGVKNFAPKIFEEFSQYIYATHTKIIKFAQLFKHFLIIQKTVILKGK